MNHRRLDDNIPESFTSEAEWSEWYYARAALAPFTVIANLAVVVSSGVLLTSEVQPRIIYMFMGNLALADLLHGFMVIVELILRLFTHHSIFYILQLGLNLSSILASSIGICVISIDRFIYLQYSIHYSTWITKTIAKRVIIGIWMYSFIVGFLCEVISSHPVSNNYVDNHFITITTRLMLALIACCMVVPICVTILLYTSVLVLVYRIKKKEARDIEKQKYKIRNTFSKLEIDKNLTSQSTNIDLNQTESSNKFEVCKLCKQNINDINYKVNHTKYLNNTKTITGFNYKNEIIVNCTDLDGQKNTVPQSRNSIRSIVSTSHNRVSSRSFIIIFLVMFVFTASWGPYCVSLLVYAFFCQDFIDDSLCSDIQDALNTYLLNLGFLNALINPFLYCCWHKGFRTSMRKLFCRNDVREERRKAFLASLKY